MDVDAASFPHHLFGILLAISEAEFVSFDLEYSGIPSRNPTKPRGDGRRTLEERYVETKAGAEKYQILQVGITCARFDYIANNYVLRPYNINISPLLKERLDIERDICLQTGAVSFLLDNGFQLDLPFTKGVQYLSREEAAWAKNHAYDRFDKKSTVQDLQLKDDDTESLDFVRRAREEIVGWKHNTSWSLHITTSTGFKERPAISAISRFEKRLVHQLVRAEFPDLVSIGRTDHIKIVEFDAQREEDNTKRLKRRTKDQIVRQTGFRWIIEALAKGDVDEIDPLYFARNKEGMVIAADVNNIKSRFDRATQRLKHHQPVLVGHNMFTDLVYLYSAFIGQLPETLQGFCEAIHELFPRIIDTKYLATHAEGDLNASPSLQEIAHKLRMQPLPDIITHAEHSKYHDKDAFHEAGYDSLHTATIMLRLSATLDAEKQAQDPTAALETESNASFKSAVEEHQVVDEEPKLDAEAPLPLIEKPLIEKPEPEPQSSNKEKKKSRKKKAKGSKSVDRKFHTQNLFENLRELSVNPESEPEPEPESEENALEKPEEPPRAWQDEPYVQDTSSWVPIPKIERKPMELIPAFDSDFWKEFGNKLRVYGTQEAVITIADWKE
ncbi:ribonuclease H-like domain-containing protein [Massariosphaeria phaeospora]|uniref:Ribonuclease H-like domain-containing protein n=1 Tax=Massariosphaeria phaeospora TaxID=100035 RepID=A0A7C8IIV1_9PLEO|nr:ribonuclease H-like domain-containing protein [Massariosphaeria phaeospora]